MIVFLISTCVLLFLCLMGAMYVIGAQRNKIDVQNETIEDQETIIEELNQELDQALENEIAKCEEEDEDEDEDEDDEESEEWKKGNRERKKRHPEDDPDFSV